MLYKLKPETGSILAKRTTMDLKLWQNKCIKLANSFETHFEKPYCQIEHTRMYVFFSIHNTVQSVI